MRWVDIRNGLMQQIPSILGNDNTTSMVLNNWSIQAAMIENLHRVVKVANMGSTDGTVAYGLDITMNTDLASISPGIGLTPFGRLITTTVTVPKLIMDTPAIGGKVYVYIMYGEADSVKDAKSTPILNSTAVNISKDEICSGTTDNDTIAGQIVPVKDTKKTLIDYDPAATANTTDGVLIATLTYFGSGSWEVEKNSLLTSNSTTTYLEGAVLDLDVRGINSLICDATTELDIGGFSGGVPYQILNLMNIGADVVISNNVSPATQKIYFNGTTLTLASSGNHYKGATFMCSPSGAWGVIGTTGVIA